MVGFNKKTIRDIDLAGKRVLLRADYNVPLKDGQIDGDYRITQSLPTLDYILKQSPKRLIIVSHLGRPSNSFDKSCSLKPVANHLAKLLDRKVHFLNDCVGEETKRRIEQAGDGSIIMLENLRYHKGEEENDLDFAKQLVEATQAEVFVQDGFGVVHRAHASTDAITKLMPAASGLLLEKEVATIESVMKEPVKPLVAVVGGAKISDKIEVLDKLVELADCVAIGGAMANNFLKIEGYGIGKSMFDKADLEVARDILDKARAKENKQAFSFLVPVDVVVSYDIAGKKPTRIVDLASHSISDIEAYPKRPHHSAYTLERGEAIYDIGPVSASSIAGVIKLAKTVIWNGTLGVAEARGISAANRPFAHGTSMVVDAIIGPSNTHAIKPYSFVGGGDTTAYVEAEGLTEDFNHVSTGGGASLELMIGKKLPGVEALIDK